MDNTIMVHIFICLWWGYITITNCHQEETISNPKCKVKNNGNHFQHKGFFMDRHAVFTANQKHKEREPSFFCSNFLSDLNKEFVAVKHINLRYIHEGNLCIPRFLPLRDSTLILLGFWDFTGDRSEKLLFLDLLVRKISHCFFFCSIIILDILCLTQIL